MTIARFEVKTYEITVGYELIGGGGGPKSRGYLVCRGDNGYSLTIYFAAPGSQMVSPYYLPDRKLGSINVPVDEMPHYVDLVRNEKPVYAYMNSDKPQWNSISTSTEPVGESE